MCSVDVEQLLRPGATPTAPLRPRHLGASLGHASCHNQVPHSRGYNRHTSFIALPPLLHSRLCNCSSVEARRVAAEETPNLLERQVMCDVLGFHQAT